MNKHHTNKAYAAIIAAVLAVLMLLSACDKNADTPSNGNTPSDSSAPSNSSAPNDNVSSPYTSVDVGETIELGGLSWHVLDVQDGKALLLCDSMVAKKVYHAKYIDVTWEKCDLRKWLNESFLDSNFSEDERTWIVETENINNDNPWDGAKGGNDTTDKVFLLSVDEVVKYFGDSGQLGTPSTRYLDDEYNKARSASTVWWLRSPSSLNYGVSSVETDGRISVIGRSANTVDIGVRPALWLAVK